MHVCVRFVLAVIPLVTGCPRVVTPGGAADPGTEPRPLGVRCDAADQCASGFCVDGVCCEDRCAGTQSCALPESTGTCARRPLGAACDAGAECPTGHCADGVCCDIACDGPCRYCAVRGLEGQCQGVPLNEDYRAACGSCQACFTGQCAPAIPGTNPNNSCEMGHACSAVGVCAVAPGGECVTPAECSTSRCLAGMCLGYSMEMVSGLFGNTGANLRMFHAVAVQPDATLCAVVEEVEHTTVPREEVPGLWVFPERRRDFSIQCRLAAGWVATPWVALNGSFDPVDNPASGRLFQPLQLLAPPWGLLLLSLLSGSTGGENVFGFTDCALAGQIFYVRDQNAGARCLLPAQPGTVTWWYGALVRDERTVDVYLAESDGSAPAEISHHECVDFDCTTTAPKVIATASLPTLPGVVVRAGTRRVVLDLTATGRLRATVNEGTPVEADLPGGCTPGLRWYDSDKPLRPVDAVALAEDRVLFQVQCAGPVAVGTLVPSTGEFLGVRMVTAAGVDVEDARVVALPEGRAGMVIRTDVMVRLMVLDPDAGDRAEYLSFADAQGALTQVAVPLVDGFPRLLIEDAASFSIPVSDSEVAWRYEGAVRHVNLGPR